MHKVTLKETFPLSCQIFHYQPLVLCNFIWTHKTGAKKNAKAHWSRKKMSIISLIIWCNFSELMLMWAVFFPPVYSWVFCWTSCYSKSIHIQMYLILTGLDIITVIRYRDVVYKSTFYYVMSFSVPLNHFQCTCIFNTNYFNLQFQPFYYF